VKIFNAVLLILALSLLNACKESNDKIPAFANPDAPEYRALMFFDAIYNERDVKLALKYTTDKLGRIIESYGSTKSYARYVLNLQINPGVELKIDRSLNQVTTGKMETTSVNILFTGMLNNDRVNDVRKVVFLNVDGNWLINKIEDDPYMSK